MDAQLKSPEGLSLHRSLWPRLSDPTVEMRGNPCASFKLNLPESQMERPGSG